MWKQADLKNRSVGIFPILNLYRRRVHCGNNVHHFFLSFLESRHTKYYWPIMKLSMRLLDLLGSGAHHGTINFSREVGRLIDKLKLCRWWMGVRFMIHIFKFIFMNIILLIFPSELYEVSILPSPHNPCEIFIYKSIW